MRARRRVAVLAFAFLVLLFGAPTQPPGRARAPAPPARSRRGSGSRACGGSTAPRPRSTGVSSSSSSRRGAACRPGAAGVAVVAPSPTDAARNLVAYQFAPRPALLAPPGGSRRAGSLAVYGSERPDRMAGNRARVRAARCSSGRRDRPLPGSGASRAESCCSPPPRVIRRRGALLPHRTRSVRSGSPGASRWAFCSSAAYVPALSRRRASGPAGCRPLLAAAIAVAAGRLRRRPSLPPAGSRDGDGPRADPPRPASPALPLGVLLYSLRALTEPMWSTDFLAIWGWKGKTIFGVRRAPGLDLAHAGARLHAPRVPARPPVSVRRDLLPARPLGRPRDGASLSRAPGRDAPRFWRAGSAGGARRLPFPSRPPRRSSLFEPLYRAFTTGMAEVPLSFVPAPLGDGPRRRAGRGPGGARGAWPSRRPAAAALKNEGLFAAAAAALLALAARRLPWRARLRVAGAAAVAGPRGRRGAPDPARPAPSARLRVRPARRPRSSRPASGSALRTILCAKSILPAAPGTARARSCCSGPAAASPAGGRLLALAAIPLAAYAILPAFCVFGPDWLVRTVLRPHRLRPRPASGRRPRASPVPALRIAGDRRIRIAPHAFRWIQRIRSRSRSVTMASRTRETRESGELNQRTGTSAIAMPSRRARYRISMS